MVGTIGLDDNKDRLFELVLREAHGISPFSFKELMRFSGSRLIRVSCMRGR